MSSDQLSAGISDSGFSSSRMFVGCLVMVEKDRDQEGGAVAELCKALL